MAEDDNVLFVRGSNKLTSNGTDHDDVWDDTALIKAYDKAVNLVKEEVAIRMGMDGQSTSDGKQGKSQNQKPNRQSAKPYKKWVVGSPCRAVYSDDGEIYEAVIQKMHDNSGKCTVKFIGYGNSEKVDLHSLLESDGLESQVTQIKEAGSQKSNDLTASYCQSAFPKNKKKDEKMECDVDEDKFSKSHYNSGASFESTSHMIPPAPPLPPQLMSRSAETLFTYTLPENDSDALSSMLMSWYISGFHTGYYHGMKQAKENPDRRKKS